MKEITYILGTVSLTVYAQLIVKWRVTKAGPFPISFAEKISYLINLVLNPWILSCVVAGFLALLCWLVAMTRLELSYAYPFMSLAFVLVLIFSAILFHETITAQKVLGMLLIIVGIIVTSRG